VALAFHDGSSDAPPVTSRASKTALLVAGYRARATSHPDHVCNDPWAAALAGDEGIELSRNYDRVYPGGEMYTAIRTAFIDREIESAIARGDRQIVILGAGMDTRAARFSRSGVRFFEVDSPSSQEEKLRRVRAAPGYPVHAAEYVACDFEKHDFVERLTANGFDTKAPAFIVWEGVVCYLSEEAVRATLHRIAEALHPQSTVVFDYFTKELVEGRSKRVEDEAIRAWLDDVGEPIRFGINDLTPLVYEEGFRGVRTLSFDEAALELTGTYDRARMFRFPRLALIKKAR
jgi:methyltransferase (TIGR00027 family)